jgi:regulatory protein
MNEITQITPQIKDKRRCNVYVDGRFCCGLTLETAVKNRLKVGSIITPERLAEIQLESEKDVALDKALTHLSATRKTEKQMQDFLSKKGYLPAVIEYVMEKLRGYQFVNDEEYAKAYVGFTANKKGERLIRMELKQKGLTDEMIDGAMQTVADGEQELASKKILEKYLRSKEITKENLQKAFRYLLSKGFDYEVAKSALQAFGATDDD